MTDTHTVDPAREALKATLEANLKPFIAKVRTELKLYGSRASKSDLAKIIICECLEEGYRTEYWIGRVARQLPLKEHDVLCTLQDESGPDRLWQCDENERYSPVPIA